MIRPFRALLLLAAVAMLGAADPAPELPPIVYAPVGPDAPMTPAGKGVWLPYERFRQWWEKANPAAEKPALPPLAAALTEVALSGQVEGARARLAAQLTAVAVGEGWSTVELPGELPLTRLTCSDPRVVVQRTAFLPVVLRPGDTLTALAQDRLGNAERWKDIVASNPGLDPQKLQPGCRILLPLAAERILVHLPAPGTYRLDGEVAAPVTGEAGSPRTLSLPLPSAGALRAELLIPGPEPTIELASAGAWSSRRDGEATRLLIAPRGASLELRWQPAVTATGEAVLTVATDIAVHVAPRAIRYEIAAKVGIARRAIDRLRLGVPPGVQVLAVEGPGVARWEPADGGIDVVLVRPIEGEVALTARLERLIDNPAGGRVELPWPRIAGASRTTGSVAVIAHDGVHAGIAAAPGLARVDPADLGVDGAAAAFRYHAEPPPATLDLAILAPELRVQSAALVRLGAEETTVAARFHIEVRQAGTFTLTVEAAEGWDLLDTSGPTVDEIRPLATADGLRRFELQLRSRMIGDSDLTCRFRAPPALGVAAFALAAPRLVGARSARGVIAIAAPRAWALAAAERVGMAGLDAAEAGRNELMAELVRDLGRNEELALAFAWQTAAGAAPHARIAASPRPRELTATIEDRITVKDGQVARAISIRGEVRYNPAASLLLALPSAWNDLVVVRGSGLAERVVAQTDTWAYPDCTAWELRFQPPLIGAFQIQIEAAAPSPRLAPGKPAELKLPAIGLPSAGKLTYLAAVGRDGAIDLAASAPGLDPVAPADLPAAIGQGAVAGFQGVQPAAVVITATRQDLLALAEAGVARTSWLAVLGDDGVVRLRGRLAVTSRGRAQLALALPDGATLVEAAIDGRAARASRREDGAVVLPLPADGGAHRLAVVVESRTLTPMPGWCGEIAVTLPRIASTAGTPPVPVARTETELWLPRRWVVSGWSGDLSPEGFWSGNEGEDGLSVPVTPSGVAWSAARVGDGGTLRVSVLHERAQLVLGVLAALAALAAAWWLRRRPVAATALIAVLAAGLVLAVAGWSAIALAALGGGIGGLIVGLVIGGITALRARRAAKRSVEPDPWIEGGGPAS